MPNTRTLKTENIQAVLFDIDGTLTHCGKALAGAAALVAHLRKKKRLLRFCTNMTGRDGEEIASFLQAAGIEAYAEEVHTAVDAAWRYINQHFAARPGFLAVPKSLLPRFHKNKLMGAAPAFVLIGDVYDDFNNQLLDKAYTYLLEGAALIACHKNLYYFKDNKKCLDSGGYTCLLENVTGVTAVITGKPAPTFFEQVLQSLALPRAQVVVVGDDIKTDIAGAANSGLQSVLVGTGKFQAHQLAESRAPQPTAFVNHLSELMDWF